MADAGMGLPLSVKRFLQVLVALSATCGMTELYCSRVLHYGWPYNSPLLPGTGRFGDFEVFQSRFRHFHTAAFFSVPGAPYTYPAPVALIYKLFYSFPHSTTVFLITLVLSCVTGLALFARELVQRGIRQTSVVALIGLVFLISYPLAFDFWQANVEFVIAGFVIGGLWAYLTHRDYMAAACFGIAAACKIFPFIYLGLFLPRRQTRPAFFMIFVAGVTTLIGSWLLCPDLSTTFRGVSLGLTAFQKGWVLNTRPVLVGYDHSLFALLKFALLLRTHLSSPHPLPGSARMGQLTSAYLPVVAGAGVLLYFTIIRKLPVLNQILCLNVASILLPPVSFDYTLLHLYVTWATLVILAVENDRTRIPGLLPAFFCFAILFAPVSEVIAFYFSFGGQIKCLALVALFVIGLRFRFVSSFDQAILVPG